MNITFRLDGKDYNGYLKDMRLNDEICSAFPAALEFERGGDREYYTLMDIVPEVHDACRTSKVERNGIYWFPEWRALCVVMSDTDISPYTVIHLGDMDDDLAAAIENRGCRIMMEVMD